MIGEPTVVKLLRRIAVVCGKGGDRPAARRANRYQAMSTGRERNLALGLPCRPPPPPDWNKYKVQASVGRRNRHTPDYHAIGGFIKA